MIYKNKINVTKNKSYTTGEVFYRFTVNVGQEHSDYRGNTHVEIDMPEKDYREFIDKLIEIRDKQWRNK